MLLKNIMMILYHFRLQKIQFCNTNENYITDKVINKANYPSKSFQKNINFEQHFAHLFQINKKPTRASKALEFASKFFSHSKPTWKTTSSKKKKKNLRPSSPSKSSKKVRNVSKNSTLIPVDVPRGNQTDSRLEGIHDR